MGFKINSIVREYMDEAQGGFQHAPEKLLHKAGVITQAADRISVNKASYQPLTKMHSKNVVSEVWKNVYRASGIEQALVGEATQKARERNLARMRKFGIPPAPNGEPYVQNDVDYLLKQGYTKEAAVSVLSKEKKYTEQIRYAPNGTAFEENDIAYLVTQGYSRDEAITYLSKCPKYQKTTFATVKEAAKAEINDAARKFIDNQLDAMLDVKIDEIAAQYGVKTRWDEETKQKVRDMIRGHCDVVFANDKIVDAAVKKTAEEINRFFDEKLTENIKKAGDHAIGKLDAFSEKIQDFDKRRKAMTPEAFSEKVTQSLEHALHQSKQLASLTNRAQQIDDFGQKFGLDIGVEQHMGAAIGRVVQNIGGSLSAALYPKFTKQLDVADKVSNKIKTYEGYIRDRQKFAMERIEAWKKEAQGKMAAQEQKLITSALGSLKGAAQSAIKIKF